jgi:hypothetical protein
MFFAGRRLERITIPATPPPPAPRQPRFRGRGGVGFDGGDEGEAFELAANRCQFAGAEVDDGAAEHVSGSLEAGGVAAGGH